MRDDREDLSVNNGRKITVWEGEMLSSIPAILAWSIVCLLAVCGIWDVMRAIFDLPAPSVSEQVLGIFTEYPIITYLMGMLMGHLVWAQTAPHRPAGPVG
jgi:hypothetical protein